MILPRSKNLALKVKSRQRRNRNSVTKSIKNASVRKSKTKKSESIKRIYIDGIFDLFHYGYQSFFESIKKKYKKSYILLGLVSDEDAWNYFNIKTVMNM